VVREKSGKMNYYNYSVAASIVQTNMQQWSSLFDKVVHQMLSEGRNCISYILIIPLEYIGECS